MGERGAMGTDAETLERGRTQLQSQTYAVQIPLSRLRRACSRRIPRPTGDCHLLNTKGEASVDGQNRSLWEEVLQTLNYEGERNFRVKPRRS